MPELLDRRTATASILADRGASFGRVVLPFAVAVGMSAAGLGCDGTAEDSAETQLPVELSAGGTSPSTAVVSAAVLVTTVQPSSSPTVASIEATSAVGADLRAILVDALGDEPGGVALLMVRDGVSTELSAGVRNDLGDPMTASTPSRVGSLSKPFVATMVLQLVDEGRVDLDATLGEYLPDSPVGGDVTIRDLLRHRSGLPDYVNVNAFFEDTLADRHRRFQPPELLAYIAPIAPAPAGERFAYSNTNYLLLGQLIEHVDGVDLNTALRNRITEPLDLHVTRFDTAEAAPVEGLAGGWSPGIVDGEPDDPYASIATGAWAAGSLVSTTGELAAFLAALFEGELISDATLAEMTDGGPEGYGLGLGAGEFQPGRPGYGHGGAIFGYQSFMSIQPDSGDTLVVFVNNDEIDLDTVINDVLAAAW